MQYRRARTKGATYFFTAVTHGRKPIFTTDGNIEVLREAFHYAKKGHPFTIDAMVVLSEHLHCIWTLPENDNDFSTRWRLVKTYFTRNCLGGRDKLSASRKSKKERAIWQRRFWEHMIRDDRDYKAHVDYIHYNPVKHGLVDAPAAWPHSSIHKFIDKGLLEQGWGAGERLKFEDGVGSE